MRKVLLIAGLLLPLFLFSGCVSRRVAGVREATESISINLPRPGSLRVNLINALPPNFNIVVQGQRVDSGRDVTLELSGLPGEFEVSLVAKIFEDDVLIGVVIEEFKIREGIGKIQPWIIDRVE